MSTKLSTGLLNKLADTDCFKEIFGTNCRLRIFGGAVPASANDAQSATLLCELTVDGDGTTGLGWAAAAVAGVLSKSASQVWKGTNSNSGTATHFRLVVNGDSTGSSSTVARVQGGLGEGHNEVNVGDDAFVATEEFTLQYFTFTLPPSARLSTGLCNKLLDTDCFKTIFALCRLRLFEEAVTASANDEEPATLIVELTEDGDEATGLSWESTATAGVLEKASAEVWKGENAASGVPASYRIVAVGDTGASSTTQARYQGTVGIGGTDIVITGDGSLISGADFVLDEFEAQIAA